MNDFCCVSPSKKKCCSTIADNRETVRDNYADCENTTACEFPAHRQKIYLIGDYFIYLDTK
jgi:hypothetical protein